jgi:hypothetical protein
MGAGPQKKSERQTFVSSIEDVIASANKTARWRWTKRYVDQEEKSLGHSTPRLQLGGGTD